MMSLRRDLFLLMMAYSDRKDHLTAEELANFLRNEQKVRGHTGLELGPMKCSGVNVKPDTFFMMRCPNYLLSLVQHLTPSVSAVCPEESPPLSQSITPGIGLSHGCPFLVLFSFSMLVFLCVSDTDSFLSSTAMV